MTLYAPCTRPCAPNRVNERMTLAEAHAICARLIRNVLNGEHPAQKHLELTARNREPLAKQMAIHEAESRK
jgi:hypothetical protein